MEISKTLTGNRLVIVFASLALFGIVWRLVPHVPNFAPISAIALLAGTILPRKYALLLLAGVMLVSDTVLGFYAGFEWTWLSLALVIPIGVGIKKLPLIAKTTIGALGASLIFFAISNFGVWLASGMYAPTTSGLIACYIMAIPFFGATLVSNFLFSASLFSLAGYLQNRRVASATWAKNATAKTPTLTPQHEGA